MEAYVDLAVEGDLDEAVGRRIVSEAGGRIARVFGRRGKHALINALRGYNASAQHTPWLALLDLDRDPCPVTFAQAVLHTPSPKMCLRIAVREVEAWLLADRGGFARWAGLREVAIPMDPEAITDPKLALVNLVRGSRNASLKADVVPRPAAGTVVGPGYNSRMRGFAEHEWDLDAAAAGSESLRRAIACARRLVVGQAAL